MLDDLKKLVCEANLRLVSEGLVIDTWGNVSGVDRPTGTMAIKPSGVAYAQMHWQQMAVVSLETGKQIEGDLRPSSDTATHLAIYRAFASVGGVAHTHSTSATVWAQARRGIPALGTTHADYFHGEIPCTRLLSPQEIAGQYEANTGKAIVERFAGLDPMHMQAVLVASHGPFTWGTSPDAAVQNAVILEHLAMMALQTLAVDSATPAMQRELLDRHFFRKHGRGAYYGQK